MDTSTLEKTLGGLIGPMLEGRGVELVEMAISGGYRRKLIRIYVDRPEGITIDECARLSRDIADIFDAHDPIEGTYVLEVSSPGLTRPLKTQRDFERAVGKAVKLVVDGQGTQIGILQSVETGHLDLMVGGEAISIERVRIQKANLHFDF